MERSVLKLIDFSQILHAMTVEIIGDIMNQEKVSVT